MRNTEEVKRVNEGFLSYLAENLSKKDYDSLPDIIDAGPKRWTRLATGTSEFTLDDICRISELIHEPPHEIIFRFGVALDTLSAYELDKFLWEQGGLKLGAVMHAA